MAARIAVSVGVALLILGIAWPAAGALRDDVALVTADGKVLVRDGGSLLPVLSHDGFTWSGVELTTLSADANDNLLISGTHGIVWLRSADNLFENVASGNEYGPIVDSVVLPDGKISLASKDNLFLRDAALGYVAQARGFQVGSLGINTIAAQSNNDIVVNWEYSNGDVRIYRDRGDGSMDVVTNANGFLGLSAITIQSNDNIVVGNTSGQVFLRDSAIGGIGQFDAADGPISALARLSNDTILAGTTAGTLYALRGSDAVSLGSSGGYGTISAIAVQSNDQIILGNQEGDLRRIRVDLSGGTAVFNTETTTSGYGVIRDLVVLRGKANENVIYREVFPNVLGPTNSKGLAEEGWQAHGGTSGLPVGGASGGDPVTISYSDGGAARTGVNSSPSSEAGVFGYTYHYGAITADNEPQLLWTDEYTVASSVDLLAAQWEQLQTATDLIPQLAVRVGGNWYVSDSTGSIVADTPAWFDVVRLDMGAATWSSLVFVPNTALALGGSVGSLPGGDITAFGLYVAAFPAGDEVALRFDNFTWIAAAGVQPLVPGDANNDGKVDDLDASILAANWQRTGGATWAQADFNADGNVNDLDASILAANWQYGVGAAVPEPTVAVLLIAGVAALLGVSRRQGSR